jgi:hypothetical protein
VKSDNWNAETGVIFYGVVDVLNIYCHMKWQKCDTGEEFQMELMCVNAEFARGGAVGVERHVMQLGSLPP